MLLHLRSFVVALKVTGLCCLIMSTASHASAQSSGSLQTYNAPDQSASAGVPSGYKVTEGAQGVIKMTGPQGVFVELGAVVVSKNAAFQAGQRPANGIDLSMPYSASLAQKLGMIFEQGAATAGSQLSQFTVTSSSPMELPPTLGQCARIVAGYTDAHGPNKVMAVFCSLPLDSGGTYKNILLEGQAPAAVATEAAATVQTIFQSYRVPTAWLQKKLAPFQAPAPSSKSPPTLAEQNAEALAIMRNTGLAAQGADVSANCFDLGVLRQTPAYNLPKSCGGTKPD